MSTPPKATTSSTGSLPLRAPRKRGIRIGIYGPGGIGKTSLASGAPHPVFFDLDQSLGVLGLDIPCVDVSDYKGIRAALASPDWNGYKTLVIDSVTVLEDMTVAHTLSTVPTDHGKFPSSVEGYGFGKGMQYVYDNFMILLGDLDKHAEAGRNVVLLMHDCTELVPNPAGEDYLRFEPRVQNPKSGKNSIRLRLREWLDHLFFVGYDIDVKSGTRTGRGHGTRTIYPCEMAHCMAKSRTLADPMPYYKNENNLWEKLV